MTSCSAQLLQHLQALCELQMGSAGHQRMTVWFKVGNVVNTRAPAKEAAGGGFFLHCPQPYIQCTAWMITLYAAQRCSWSGAG